MVSYFCRSYIRLVQFYCCLIKSNSLSLPEQKGSQGAGRVSPVSEQNLLRSEKGSDFHNMIRAGDQIEAIEGLEYPGPLSDNWPQYHFTQIGDKM